MGNQNTETKPAASEHSKAQSDSVKNVVSQEAYKPRRRVDREWSEYPLGTKTHSFSGGYWERVEYGWKWGGSKSRGGTFPTPGGDACGRCVELPVSD